MQHFERRAGVVAATNAILPLLRRPATARRIVTMSSGFGSPTLNSDPVRC
jgi:hypothetical protein